MHTHGGWLCSEVGMGKSAVVNALVAANPFNKEIQTLDGRRVPKSTFIMTSVSLIGQWEDDCKMHAPELKVVRFHPPSQTAMRDRVTKKQFFDADTIISTTTKSRENDLKSIGISLDRHCFHRCVMDESHLFVHRMISASQFVASKIPSPRR